MFGQRLIKLCQRGHGSVIRPDGAVVQTGQIGDRAPGGIDQQRFGCSFFHVSIHDDVF